MKIILGLEALEKESLVNPVVSIGNFDGVHLGHRKVLQYLLEKARAIGGVPVVLTFEPHPLRLIAPEKSPFLLTTFKQKAELMGKMGIEILLCIPPPSQGVEKGGGYSMNELLGLIRKKFRMERLVEGPYLSFGRESINSSEQLIELWRKMGFSVDVIDYYTVVGEVVTTSRIREYIQQGLVREASRLLGRLYSLEGKVEGGEKRGKDLGFPTANLAPENELLPKDGVYAVLVHHNSHKYQGVTNIGKNPTFNGILRTVETFILDFGGEIYGDRLRINFVERLRDEIAFGSVNQLISQIEKDVVLAREILS